MSARSAGQLAQQESSGSDPDDNDGGRERERERGGMNGFPLSLYMFVSSGFTKAVAPCRTERVIRSAVKEKEGFVSPRKKKENSSKTRDNKMGYRHL